MTKLLLASLAAAALLAGCAAAPSATTTNATNANGALATLVPDAKTVTVGGGFCPGTVPPVQPGTTNYYTLAPTKLELKLNAPVNLTLKNDGCGAHDLVIQGIDGAKIASVPAGKTGSVVFTPTKAGSYPMYCTLGDGPTAPATAHKDHGMSGSVTVA